MSTEDSARFLDGAWHYFSVKDVWKMALDHEEGRARAPIVDYHLATALWLLDTDRPNFALASDYLTSLPKLV
jgi:hypothetical protein